MLQDKVCYFDTKGDQNREDTLKLAVNAANLLNIKNIVLATTSGNTAKLMADSIDHEGIKITVVTQAFGQKEPNKNPMSIESRQYLIKKGFNICTAAHALSGAERSLSGSFQGLYPLELIANTLRMLGQGTKVCVEISTMAADAGYIESGEPVIAIGGAGRGADTAVVLRPEVSSNILKTKIDRIICKPIE